MLMALAGKTNVGKSTFFSAATLIDAEISNRIFTTIQPNRGVTYARTECPCKDLKITCSPKNSKCVSGVRFVPVKIIDVAGLVPDAHKGRGLGNKFLSDAMEADGIINVIDAAGMTDAEGNPTANHNPEEDIELFSNELDYWILGIIKTNLPSLSRRMEANNEKLSDVIYNQLSGLKMKKEHVEESVRETGLKIDSPDEIYLSFIHDLRNKSKPIIIAGNKADAGSARDNIEKMEDVIPCSADIELALRRAAEQGIVEYRPGDSDFNILNATDDQRKALEKMKGYLGENGSTGVQKIIDKLTFELLDMIVVYPVENEHKFSDKKGNVLPDALLLKKGSTAVDLAFAVHEDIGRKFIAAVDAKSGRNISANHELKNGDIISVKSRK